MISRQIRVETVSDSRGPAGPGFTLAELLVVVAIIAIITAVGIPFLLSYWQSATLLAGAQEVASIINRGRQVALAQNTPVCVTRNEVDPGTGLPGGRIRFRTNGCPGAVGSTVYTGPGTDSNGFISLANGLTVTATGNVVFSQLGAATTAGTYTVRNPADGRTRTVTVAFTGRITVGP